MDGMPREGQSVFEVRLFNREVRTLVKDNRHHDFFDDYWADAQVRDVVACDEAEARALIAKRYHADDGFVIESVQTF